MPRRARSTFIAEPTAVFGEGSSSYSINLSKFLPSSISIPLPSLPSIRIPGVPSIPSISSLFSFSFLFNDTKLSFFETHNHYHTIDPNSADDDVTYNGIANVIFVKFTTQISKHFRNVPTSDIVLISLGLVLMTIGAISYLKEKQGITALKERELNYNHYIKDPNYRDNMLLINSDTQVTKCVDPSEPVTTVCNYEGETKKQARTNFALKTRSFVKKFKRKENSLSAEQGYENLSSKSNPVSRYQYTDITQKTTTASCTVAQKPYVDLFKYYCIHLVMFFQSFLTMIYGLKTITVNVQNDKRQYIFNPKPDPVPQIEMKSDRQNKKLWFWKNSSLVQTTVVQDISTSQREVPIKCF